jgi:hypothetical protein
MFAALGSLHDLGAELSNTVANVYYRFHVMRQNMANPGSALGVQPGKDMPSDFRNLMGAMGSTPTEYEFIAKMIGSLREAKANNASIGDYLVTHALDQFKYRIKNCDKKSPIRRAIERRFCKVDEIPGLYDRMVQVAKEERSQQTQPANRSSTPVDAVVPFSPSLPQITDAPYARAFEGGPYKILLVKDAKPLIATVGGPSLINYPFTMAVLNRQTGTPVHFVTLEIGVAGTRALCAFDRHGRHHNYGRGPEPRDEAGFVQQAMGLIQREFGLEGIVELKP